MRKKIQNFDFWPIFRFWEPKLKTWSCQIVFFVIYPKPMEYLEIWEILKMFENFGKFWKNLENFWKILKILKKLKNFEKFWKILKNFEKFENFDARLIRVLSQKFSGTLTKDARASFPIKNWSRKSARLLPITRARQVRVDTRVLPEAQGSANVSVLFQLFKFFGGKWDILKFWCIFLILLRVFPTFSSIDTKNMIGSPVALFVSELSTKINYRN